MMRVVAAVDDRAVGSVLGFGVLVFFRWSVTALTTSCWPGTGQSVRSHQGHSSAAAEVGLEGERRVLLGCT